MAQELDSLQPVTPSTGVLALVRRADHRFDQWIQGWNPYRPERLMPRDIEPMQIDEHVVKVKVTRFIMIAATLFFIWACVAPLDGGVTMQGNVTVAGYRKAIQSASGGVVQAILIHEGDKVKAGQVLIRVNPLTADANLAGAESDYVDVLVRESRLKALSMGASSISWSPELEQFGHNRQIEDAKAFQVRLFNARRNVQAQQVAGLREQSAGLNAAISSHEVQLRTLGQELDNTRRLAKDGFVPQAQVNQTERTKADQDAAMASTRSQIGSIQAQIAGLDAAFAKEISDEAATVQKSREAAVAKLQAAKFDQSNTALRAPVDGTIVNLQVYTVGGVIGAGTVLAEIVPSHGKLVVETQVPSKSIDKVKVGLPVSLRFSAFNTSTTPIVDGRVLNVGVDRLKSVPGQEPKPGQDDFYLAQVETTEEGAKKIADLKVQTGMPVDVIVKTGERTFMSYLLKPLTDKFALAFK
jgi:protease secretion system membrane fusion protein